MKYKIYDGIENIITPIGEVLTAEQWYDRYPWGRLTDMVISGGVINGALALVYDDFVDMYKRMGVDFSECRTKEDHLRVIEEFENKAATEVHVSSEERIANALEDMIVMQMDDIEEV